MSDVSPDEMQPNQDKPDGIPSRLKQAMGDRVFVALRGNVGSRIRCCGSI